MRTWWGRLRRSVPAALVAAILAAVVTTAVFAIVRSKAATAPLTVAFRFEPDACVLPVSAQQRLGGALTADEVGAIERVARGELERAYAGTRLLFTGGGDAFWHLEVRGAIRGRKALADGGHSIALGPLGGIGEVSFTVLALSAIRYAPDGAARQTIVDGIGRGIGRAAVHELAHQIIATGAMDTTSDPDSYEYATFIRPSQYYGQLHWAGAWPLVLKKVGPPQ
jgi:hypothetical protein